MPTQTDATLTRIQQKYLKKNTYQQKSNNKILMNVRWNIKKQ